MKGYQSQTVILKILVLCVISAFGNAGLSYLLNTRLNVLFADTIFTIAMCFTAGWLPGILTGILFNHFAASLLLYFLIGQPFFIFTWSFFYLCSLAEIALVCFFHAKIKSREETFLQRVSPQPSLYSFIGIATDLLVLVALDCIVISILGGTIDFIMSKNSAPVASSFVDTFKLGLLRNNVPPLLASILARIPINIIDRLLAVFGGYGISLVFRKWVVQNKN